MSVDVNKLQKTIFDLENRVKNVAIVYPIIAGFCFFVLSWVVMAENARYLDRALFVLLGMIFGRKFGTATRIVLEERKALLEGYLELYHTINKPTVVEAKPAESVPAKVEQKEPEPMPTTASEAVVKAEIPAVAAPPTVATSVEVKDKPTKVPMKKKLKA
jgi:hypothetical protein